MNVRLGNRRIVLIPVVLCILAACSTVPFIGRSKVSEITDADLVRISAQQRTVYLLQMDRERRVLRPNDIDSNAKQLPMVNRVADKIVSAASMTAGTQWRIFLIRTPEINLNVTPDGTIVVSTGLLLVTKTEPGLAAVLGHEVAHVVARHGVERVSQKVLVGPHADDATAALASPQNQPLIGAGLGYGGQFGVLLPYSRVHESEADEMGLYLMAKAGYNPTEAVAVWKRIAAAGGPKAKAIDFPATHPTDPTRIAQIQRALPDAKRFFDNQTLPLPAKK